MKLVYLDNAATSWPKPESVYLATDHALRRAANPGRGGHRFSRDAAARVLEAREVVANFFGVSDSRNIIFTGGATESLNMIIYGILPAARSIVSVGCEHNALWRPLCDIAKRFGVKVEYVSPLKEQGFAWAEYEQALATGPDLVTITHASNVTGKVYPLAEMARMAKAAGALVCVDAAQTAGVVPLDFQELNLDFAAFPGHKGLLGPQGIGGLYIAPEADLLPWRLGGTGSHSAVPEAPRLRPERFEAGTLNVPGIAGLAAGIEYLNARGLEAVSQHELRLRQRAIAGLRQLEADIYGENGNVVGVLSFNFAGMDSSELAYILDDEFGICLRGGLHCSPRTHQSLGTMGPGTVRMSPGIFNTNEDIDALLSALEQLKSRAR
ncbi:MAG TPA: cysteine desulfurase [Firmicutes bacterium]|nr:cysteine desulfurase [Bacillota bacterium]HCX78954.1 cysteine desulfurase [Bacillota bacterium]